MALFEANGARWYADFYSKENIVDTFRQHDDINWTWGKLRGVLYFYRCPSCHYNDSALVWPKIIAGTPKECQHCSKEVVAERVKYCPRWRWRGNS